MDKKCWSEIWDNWTWSFARAGLDVMGVSWPMGFVTPARSVSACRDNTISFYSLKRIGIQTKKVKIKTTIPFDGNKTSKTP